MATIMETNRNTVKRNPLSAGMDYMPPYQPLLRAAVAATILGCSPSYVLRLARTGHLPCVRLGRTVRFRHQDVVAYIRRHVTKDVRSHASARRMGRDAKPRNNK